MKLLKMTPLVLLLVGVACGGGNKSEDAGGDASDAADAADMCPPTCPNADAPDANGTDSDGDGVDGVVADSIFVDATFGNNANAGTHDAPVATIARGLELAVTQNKHAVLVAAGTYTAGVNLVNGISIHGSYTSTTWARVPLVGRVPNTIISAASPAMVGEDITTATRITGVVVASADATVAGASSIAVRLVDASAVVIEDSDLRAGAGDDGAHGSTPIQPPTIGVDGVDGLDSQCFGGSPGCSPTIIETPVALTAAPCGCGEGGRGATPGVVGASTFYPGGEGRQIVGGVCVSATGTAGGYSANSPYGALTAPSGSPGGPGAPGTGATIAAGFGESGYASIAAAAGGQGGPGGGGGGGAAGRRVVCNQTADLLAGKSGGHGGSGGCGGAGGTGGGSGGASVALYLWRSTPRLVRVILAAEQAGVGGDGAFGQGGASGGAGGTAFPGLGEQCPMSGGISYLGGAGGMGGTGGTGGRGGGGAGGISGAIVLGPDSGLAASSTPTFATPTATIASAGIGGNNGEDGAVCNVYRVGDAACLTSAP